MKCPYVMKRCTKCEEILHVSRYYKKKSCKYGLNSVCKKCNAEYKKQWYKDNKDKRDYQVEANMEEINVEDLYKLSAPIDAFLAQAAEKDWFAIG